MVENQTKDFNKWNIYKQLLEKTKNNFNVHEGDIWNCFIGENLGYEECGKNDFLRPVVIIRKISKHGFIGAPMSTQNQLIEDWFEPIVYHEKDDEINSNILLTQLRFFDTRRLSYKKGRVSKVQLRKIRLKIGALLKISEKIDPSDESEGLEHLA